MSTVIRSCPGCKSLILSDTDQCPECGHVFYQRRQSEPTGAVSAPVEQVKSIHEPCPHCGEMVRSGLVRCWGCNGFMRADVEARFRDMTANPQKIIYSTIPLEERTDFLPARDDKVAPQSNVFDADEFVLSDDVASSPAPEPIAPSSPKSRLPEQNPDGPDKPRSTTPGKSASGDAAAAQSIEQQPTDAQGESASRPTQSRREADSSDAEMDELHTLAMAEQREVRKRRGEKIADRHRKQMLVPCTCGAWIRVHEEKSGKTVRCRQCKQPVLIPEIRRKAEKKDEKPAAPKLAVTWISDVWFHLLNPTSLVLKPGSLVDKHTESDIALTENGLHIVTFGGEKKKKSLFGGGDKNADRDAQRTKVREHVANTGKLDKLPDAELRTIGIDRLSEMRLVQPIAKVQESMFAGVPVFGDGRIALFLPLDSADGQQSFCSLPLSSWRVLNERLKSNFSVAVPAAENGVPDGDRVDMLSCFVTQSKVEFLRNLAYYQQDPGYELELTGYRCKACGVAISEEGRQKNKLGGANGKAIAKAKCPKCSGKMGEELLYRIKKSPEANPGGES